MTVTGIDVSSYQSSTFPTAGLGFVMVKATEGTGYVNPRHAAQVAHARAAGLVVGHYHFARPGDMATQVRYFLAHATPAAGDVLCLDWEDSEVTSDWKDAWLRYVRVKAPGHRVILYCNRDFWLHRDTTSYCGDGLWIADPDAPAGHPRVEHPWTLHQYSFAGGIDRNVARFPDPGALRAWAATTTPTPQEDDDMPTAKEVVDALLDADEIPASRVLPNADAATNPRWTVRYTLQTAVESARASQQAAEACVAQLASISAVLTAMQRDGGLTAEQAVAAGKAGAQAALAELGDRLQPPADA